MPTINAWTCGACGLKQYMSDQQENMLRSTGRTFYCLNGHPRAYTKNESREDVLRRQLQRAEQNAAYLEERRIAAEERAHAAEKRAQGHKGYAAKLAKRAKAGVCPCCSRTFSNMAEHMKTQHPDFSGQTDL
jgi:hypothetical protein